MRILAIFFSISCFLPLLSNEKGSKVSMKKIMKEDQLWAKEIMKPLFHREEDIGISTEDVLPLEDQGKVLDIHRLAKDDKEIPQTKESKLLESFLKSSKEKEDFEGTETIFQLGHLAVENPEQELEATSVQSQLVEEEKHLETCQEAGSYQISFSQKRTVEIVPEIKQHIKKCSGHQYLEKFFWKSDAEKQVNVLNRKLRKDSSLSSYSAGLAGQDTGPLKSYYVLEKWRHKDNTDECSYPYKELLIQPFSENDTWHTDHLESLSAVESNPNCKLLYSKILEGPETKLIEGQAIFRDVWKRKVFFSCEADAHSPCVRLRNLGGVLVKKKCLKENDFEDCDLWEKTYDLGKKAAYQNSKYSFKDREIIGLNGEFDASYEKNNGFSLAATVLSIFSDVKKELEKAGELNEKNVEIFRGETLRCSCSFLGGELYDCCKKMQGLAVAAYLARCNEEEVALAEKRRSGKCHYIESQKEKLNTQTTKVFCCFPTKLARVVQEQGRKQLGMEWGSAGEPQCHGLSIENLSQIDFSKLDLSEVIEDLAIDKEDLLKRVESTINHLQSQKDSSIHLDMEEIVQQQKEQLSHAL